MKRFERLDQTTLPTGAVLTLYRHDGTYLIRSDGAELMSSRHHHSEDVLAEVVCAPLRNRPGARVLIGGLGLGFTLRAALRSLGDDALVDVVELSDAVIRWNRNAEYDLAGRELQEPRVRLIHGDAARVIATSQSFHAPKVCRRFAPRIPRFLRRLSCSRMPSEPCSPIRLPRRTSRRCMWRRPHLRSSAKRMVMPFGA